MIEVRLFVFIGCDILQEALLLMFAIGAVGLIYHLCNIENRVFLDEAYRLGCNLTPKLAYF